MTREQELERTVLRLETVIRTWQMCHTKEIAMPPNLLTTSKEALEAAKKTRRQMELENTEGQRP